ncbi:hypothetical protein LUZ60_004795 [Juncus effusus]|nr:hypothetical protein LUZ60_004795 [Juncus effusus]
MDSSSSSTVAQLKSLISFASSTLSSLPFPSFPLSSPPLLLPCPYNPHHFTPPEFLYRHFLTCPSVLPLEALPSIPPLKAGNGSQQNQTDFGFGDLGDLGDLGSDSEFVFSLEEELRDLGSGFWYNDCPGVVSSLREPAKSFSVPNFLLLECGNLSSGKSGITVGESMSILPSEYIKLRNEAESWQNYPAQYSYIALQVISSLSSALEEDLKKWVIINSPKYGIIIDVTMRDYIYLLLKLCLKAVIKEANNSLEIFLKKDGVFNPKFLSFQCPNLVKSFHWLSNQLSILYGEINARLFALNMIKEAITKSGYFNMMNNFGEKNGERENNREIGEMGKVFVSQIVGAIGALYQRAFLEGKIRALRSVQTISKPQLLMEYAYLSSKAVEERSKRSNYRPILDYDSLLSSRVHDQGNNSREKTKEEMLAEERDYKRRRISYRGKKIKRSPTEVLRDIIQEHMEEIRHANTEPPFSNPNKSQNRNPNYSNTYESSQIHERKSVYQQSSESSHRSSRSSKERKDRFGDRERDRAEIDKDRKKERDRAEIDRHMSKERRRDNNNDRYKRKEARRDFEGRRSESVTFNDRYDPATMSEERR